MKGMVGELFHFSGLRTLTSLLPLVTSLLGLGQLVQAATGTHGQTYLGHACGISVFMRDDDM